MEVNKNKKSNIGQTILSASYAVVIITLFLGIIGLQNGRIFGHDVSDKGEKVAAATSTEPTGKTVAEAVTIEHIKEIFPEATNFEVADNRILVYDGNKEIGWGYSSSPVSDSIIGYASSVPVFIGFDKSDNVVGLALLENSESPDFVERVVKSGFMESWNNRNIDEVVEMNVDSVSGATMTSSAVIKTVKNTVGTYQKQTVDLSSSFNIWGIAKISLGMLLLGLAILQFFFPKKLKPFRTVHQILVVIILGFWSGTFLSISSLYNWTINGLDLSTRLFVFLILLFSIVLPFITKKAFYCTYLCPYGASQSLIGKLRKTKITINARWRNFLSKLREKLFAILMVLLLSGVSFDLTNIEPFAAFMFKAASVPVIILAAIFLVLSLFIPQPWCRYICPTGQLLEHIRKVNI